MLYRARIVVESYSNRARIAIVIGPLDAKKTFFTLLTFRKIKRFLL